MTARAVPDRLIGQGETVSPPRHFDRWHPWLPHLLAILAVAVACALAIRATHALTCPPESDHYRDAGTAQAILDGSMGKDVAYRGAPQWYPPLIPALAAVTSYVTSESPLAVYARYGTYLNLAGPVAFYLFGFCLFGAWPAFFALVGYLFVGNWSEPSWGQASYSPWMWPFVTAQAFTFATAACWLRALRTHRFGWDIATAILLGLTFLAHPTAALILAVSMATLTVAQVLRSPKSSREHRWRSLAIIAAISLTIASSYLVPLITSYHLTVVNVVPNRFVGLWGRQILAAQTTWRTVGALLGLFAIWRLHSQQGALRAESAGVVTTLTAVAAFLFVYGFVVQELEPHGIQLPLPVPAFHFHYYLTAFEALLFGVGFWYGLPLVARAVSTRLPFISAANLRLKPAVLLILPVALAIAHLRGYLDRDDLVHWPAQARILGANQVRGNLYRWARTQLSDHDVVLTDDFYGLFAVIAAGRHVVTADLAMVSPYVDAEQRRRDRTAMFESLCGQASTTSAAVFARYGVTYVTALPSREKLGCSADRMARSNIPLVYRSGQLAIFSVPRAP